eukprot:TRINITY_DN7011_c0_g1_i11.p1 TRINITY_DN7011_c0_g1~~TRINITY_DN7011_c0_g1_i11.p1  ORF type:complete len:741 (-),score=168.34 TRINITY_DN7011_c0_g1_i11:172-2394(-)
MLKLSQVFRLNLRKMSGGGGENLLGKELSPYLRQHKDNPVHWYPWGPQAFERAREEGKLIFLSIGYSTCHWCHVMERESFESQQTAAVMNRYYINVKVDREERPDVDKVYMTFVQASTGSGGWPLSVFLTPDLYPVYGGTYFPPQGHFGRPGFSDLLQALASSWQENKDDMMEAGREVMKVIDKKMGAGSTVPGPLPDISIFHRFYAMLWKNYDPEFGGYSGAPKFPQPSNLKTMFSLHSWPDETEDRKKRELEMNLFTLKMMAKGGIHDHISQGFARYSTDAKWHVPHFEKMLYDQAQLAVVYSIAVQKTGSQEMREIVEDILTYVSRDLTHPEGGFYTAEDADSYPSEGSKEKKEGAFCVWSFTELQDILGSHKIEGYEDKSLADVIIHHYNVEKDGNVNPRMDPHGELLGQNVLTELPEKDTPLIPDESRYKEALNKARKLLHEKRLTRPRPSLDDKILTSSNGLMISGFCAAGRALGRQDYIAAAEKAGNFLCTHLLDQNGAKSAENGGKLLRSCYGASAHALQQLDTPIHGFIDDYAFTVQAMLDLYESTFDVIWLKRAISFQDTQDALFLDKSDGGYFAAEEGASDIIIRLKDDHDGAEPSSNSISAMNLLRLHKLTNNKKYKTQAEKIFEIFHLRLTQIPVSMSALTEAYLFYRQDGPVLLLNTSHPDHKEFITELHSKYLPFLTCLTPEVGQEVSGHLAGANLTPSSKGLLIKSDQDEKVSVNSLEDVLQNL